VAFRYAPPRPKAAVERPELFDRLDQGVNGLLTLVTGPPGAGKTHLLSTWLADRPPAAPVVWLSLEPPDGRPARFWSEILSLVRQAAGRRCPQLPDPSEGIHLDFVAALATSINRLSQPILVVLDDFEQLHSQQVTDSLDRFLRSAQRGLRLVVASRLDPGLSLQRLRLEGQLTELRSTDLALSPQQAGKLFSMAGLELTDDQVQKLHGRTEGWVGGLSLAALSLRDHPDPDDFVATFTGDERTVADYLVEEVLHQQPRPMREFMLRTSVADHLEPGLVDALTGRHDGARTLELLERSNGFLMPLDEHRRRYRYHPMFLELLRSQLSYQMPDAFALQHKRAARWFAASGSPAAAVRHAVAAGDVATAAELLSEHWPSLVVRGRAQELADWVDGLSPRTVAGSAGLALAGAGAALAMGDVERGESYAALADARTGAVPAKRRPHHALSRAIVTMFDARLRGDFEATRTAAHKVLAGQQLAGLRGDARAVAHLDLGVAEWWLSGQRGGIDRVEEALALARRESCEYLVVDSLAQLSLLTALDGGLRDAVGIAQMATRIAARHGWEECNLAAPAFLASAIVHFYWAELDQSGEHLERAVRAMGRSHDRTTLALIELFRALLLGRADLGEATRVVRAARNDIDAWAVPGRLPATAGFFEASLLSDAGDGARAEEALARGPVGTEAPLETAVVRARLALADGGPAEGLRRLQSELLRTARPMHPSVGIEALALAAVCKHLLHDDAGSLELVEQALNRAQPDGYRMPLLSVGAPLRDLLKRRIRSGTSQRALAGELIQLLEEQRDTAGVDPRRVLLDPLSDREEAVLRYLPTVLSKAEIASELFVSVNTVKTHTKNIYRKLGVGTRTEAVRRAKALNLV
jgi:LuxR family transcriptional regulator, maltose regulon positive regulatory protein